jgi:hypothetical protein
LGSFAAHLKFHLLKRGVTEESALKLIRASCSTHSLHDAITLTYEDRKIVSAAQAEMDNELEEMAKRASWVDIMVGMEASEQREYESEHNGTIQLLNPSNPRALSFANERSVKTFSSKAAGTAYTVGGQESLGDTAYRPMDDDINSQELDLCEGYENDGFVEDPFHNKDGGIIANMDLLKENGPNMVAAEGAKGDDKDKADMEDEDMADDEAPKISSPEKITRKATNFAEIPPAPSARQQEVIQNMLREWVETHGSDPLPPLLQNLARQVGVEVASNDPPHSTPGPTCRGQREKPISPGKVTAPSNKLDGQHFVLTGTWPGLGGEGLTARKDAVKAIIEKHGGKVTSGFSKITDFLVIGTTPGPKKVLDSHE